MDLTDWIERYGRAWESADEELIVSLFTEGVRDALRVGSLWSYRPKQTSRSAAR
jgi:hypothetical protein